MIHDRLTIHAVNGIDLDLDLSALSGLVAVTGPNGAGKSTALECMLPVPLWLTLPTRPGALHEAATARDAAVDVWFDYDGASYHAQILIDPGASDQSKPKTEARLWRGDELISDERGKVRAYHELIAELFPSPDVVMASAFAAQGGVGSFGALDVAGRRQLFRNLLGLDSLQRIADRAADRRRAIHTERSAVDVRIAELEPMAGRERELLADVPVIEQQIIETTAQLEHADATEKAATEERDRTGAAYRAVLQLEQRRRELQAKVDAAGGEHDPERLAQLDEQIEELDRHIAETEGEHRAAVARQQEANQRRTMAGLAVDTATKTARRQADLVAQLQREADLLDRVPCGGGVIGGVDCSACGLLEKAAGASKRIDAERELVTEAEAMATRKSEEQTTAAAAAAEATGEVGRLFSELNARRQLRRNAQAERDQLQRAMIQAAHADEARQALADMPPPEDPEPLRLAWSAAEQVQITASNRVRELRTRLDERRQALAAARGGLAALGTPSADLEACKASHANLGRSWTIAGMLAHAFGPEGAQALEIDAAGPAVSRIANRLLAVVSAPYTIEIVTLREASKGRKQREVFDIMVHAANGSRELGRMSGGEKVLIEESIKLAIAVHVSNRSGQRIRTLWRDETDGALSELNAQAFPAMLRQAMALGGFDRCFLVSHRAEVIEQCDDVIELASGPESNRTRA